MRAAKHEKHVTCACFSCPGGGGGQVRAGRQPSTKNAPTWAHSLCWVAGDDGWSRRATGHEKHARCRRSFVFETNYYLGFTGDRL